MKTNEPTQTKSPHLNCHSDKGKVTIAKLPDQRLPLLSLANKPCLTVERKPDHAPRSALALEMAAARLDTLAVDHKAKASVAWLKGTKADVARHFLEAAALKLAASRIRENIEAPPERMELGLELAPEAPPASFAAACEVLRLAADDLMEQAADSADLCGIPRGYECDGYAMLYARAVLAAEKPISIVAIAKEMAVANHNLQAA